MSRILLNSFVLVLIANSIMAGLVPKVYLENIQLEPVNENKYKLRISHSDGSTLEEVVEKTEPGRYEIRGHLNQPQFNPMGKLFVTYENNNELIKQAYKYISPEDLAQPQLVLLDEPAEKAKKTAK